MWRVEDSRKNMKKSARTAKEHDTDTVDTGSYTTIAYHLHVVLLCRQSWASRLLAVLDFSSVLAANTTCQGHNEPLPKGSCEAESKYNLIFLFILRIQTIHCAHFQLALADSCKPWVTLGDRKPTPCMVLIADDAAADPPAWPIQIWHQNTWMTTWWPIS